VQLFPRALPPILNQEILPPWTVNAHPSVADPRPWTTLPRCRRNGPPPPNTLKEATIIRRCTPQGTRGAARRPHPTVVAAPMSRKKTRRQNGSIMDPPSSPLAPIPAKASTIRRRSRVKSPAALWTISPSWRLALTVSSPPLIAMSTIAANAHFPIPSSQAKKVPRAILQDDKRWDLFFYFFHYCIIYSWPFF